MGVRVAGIDHALKAGMQAILVPPYPRTTVPPNYSGCVKNFYKSNGKTGFNVAEIGSEFTTGRFAEKNAKMREVAYFID